MGSKVGKHGSEILCRVDECYADSGKERGNVQIQGIKRRVNIRNGNCWPWFEENKTPLKTKDGSSVVN